MDVYPEDENVCVDEVPCVWVIDDDDTAALQEAGVEVVEGGVLGVYAEWGVLLWDVRAWSVGVSVLGKSRGRGDMLRRGLECGRGGIGKKVSRHLLTKFEITFIITN